MNKKPVIVNPTEVKPFKLTDFYDSKMLLDHVITGEDTTIQINEGTLKKGHAMGGSAHDDDEIYYMVRGECKFTMEDKIYDLKPGMVIFIPKGVFHALDNTEGKEDLVLLTFWRNYKSNEVYGQRVKAWGKSFKTIFED